MVNVLEYSIFDGINGDENIKTLLDCIHAKVEKFSCNEVIDLTAFDRRTALVLGDGCEVMDNSGSRINLKKGDLIGKNYRDLSESESLKAMSDFSLLFMDNDGFEAPCWFSCFFHAKFIDNMENAKNR